MPTRRMRALLRTAVATSLLWLAPAAHAQPTADQLLADAGLSDGDKQRVLNGEFVSVSLAGVSDRDISVSIVFRVNPSPDSLSKQIVAGELTSADPQVKVHGTLSGNGSLADLAALRISGDEAQALRRAKGGTALNLGTAEIAAFNALGSGDQQAVQRKFQEVLLARHRAYRASGLAGIVPYDRGGGSTTDVAGELRKASEGAKGLRKYMPAFHAVLLGYPKAKVPGMSESFHWATYDVSGTPTHVLTHILAAAEGAARTVVQRQYYVSTGYNSEQAVAGFLPVQGGTVVIYAGHAFTDQVAGFGGSMKVGIGRRVMAEKLTKMFEAGRKQADR